MCTLKLRPLESANTFTCGGGSGDGIAPGTSPELSGAPQRGHCEKSSFEMGETIAEEGRNWEKPIVLRKRAIKERKIGKKEGEEK